MQTSSTDRRLGALVHLASIPAPYLGPLVALAVAGGRPYVRYQALKSLIGQVIAGMITFTIIATSIAFSIYQLSQTGFDLSQINWWHLIIKSVAVWLALALFGLWNTLTALREAFAAHGGVLPVRPRLTDRLATRWARANLETETPR
jgi:hypothetical protein